MTTHRHPYRALLALLLLVCVLASVLIPVGAASTYPKQDKKVADDAGVLSEATVRTIRSTNESLTKDYNVAIAVCTVKTTGDTAIDVYARDLFKEWELGEGVLLLIATEDNNYYFVQSVGVDKILTNDALKEVRDNYLEENYAAGDIDRGVMKTVSRLSNILVKGLDEARKAEEKKAEEERANGETESSPIVVALAAISRVIIVLIIIAVLAVGGLFVAAIFNDDAAELFRYLFLRRKKPYVVPADQYDDRLYGRPQQNRAQPTRRPQNPQVRPNRPPQGQMRPQNGYGQPDRQRPRPSEYAPQTRQPKQGQPTYYNADGTPRQARPTRPTQGQANRPVQQRPRPQAPQSFNGDETRAFTIPDHTNRR